MAPFSTKQCGSRISHNELEELESSGLIVKRKVLSNNLFAESDQRLDEKIEAVKRFVKEKMEGVFLVEEHFATGVCRKYFSTTHSCDVDVSVVETISDLMVKEGTLCEIYVPSKDASGLAKLRYHSSYKQFFESLYRFGINRLLFDGSLTAAELYRHPLARNLGLGQHSGFGGNWAFMLIRYLCFKGRAVTSSMAEEATLIA
ncbi:MAG: hypothetical protein JRN67_10605 [Nitrososphaerota archaeon]|nr:hypothetical protein [Nitrososphaerota archaeon]